VGTAGVLVDSNVLLDIATGDPAWFAWSSEALAKAAERYPLVINPIIYAEVSIGYDKIEALDEALPAALYRREPLPWEAGFLAGKCFLSYRRRGGRRRSPLRDAARYSTYFPGVPIISPGNRLAPSK